MQYFWRLRFIAGLALLLGILFTFPVWANAQESKAEPLTSTDESYGVHNDCLSSCHSISKLQGTLEDGEKVSLYINQRDVRHMFIGENNKPACDGCHADYSEYPHKEFGEDENPCALCHSTENVAAVSIAQIENAIFQLPYANRREMALKLNNGCGNCHEEIAAENMDSVHSELLETGNPTAPVCIDCHGGHDVSSPNEPREKISNSCGNCHGAVNSTYKASVHGESLSLRSNEDVPTCVNCHGVHSVQGPHNLSFRNDSITMCGNCHGDEALMAKYGISANVLESYLDDFHGRSVNLFRTSEDARLSSQAVCYDCHGIHNILSPENPRSMVYPDNLQTTCQKCHIDTEIEFPEAWLSHYSPDLETYPVLYLVDWVYPILIYGTLSGMTLYIVIDARKRRSEHKSKPVKRS